VAVTGVTKEQCAALRLENKGPEIARAAWEVQSPGGWGSISQGKGDLREGSVRAGVFMGRERSHAKAQKWERWTSTGICCLPPNDQKNASFHRAGTLSGLLTAVPSPLAGDLAHSRSSENTLEQISKPWVFLACLAWQESCPNSRGSSVNSGVSCGGSSKNCPGLNLPWRKPR